MIKPVAALFALGLSLCLAAADDASILLQGVGRIGAPGTPGSVFLAGPEAFALVVSREEDGSQVPVAGAARCIVGGRELFKVALFGHTGYLEDAATLAKNDTGRLLLNLATWMGTGPQEKGVLGCLGEDAAREYLQKHGCQVRRIEDLDHLEGLSVLVVSAHQFEGLPPARLTQVSRWLEAGHGLIAAGTGWSWEPRLPGQTLASAGGINKIIGKSGLYWANGLPTPQENGFQVRGIVPSPCLNASQAIKVLRQLGEKTQAKNPLSPSDQKQCGLTLANVSSQVAADDPLAAELLGLVKVRFGTVIPTREAPVKMDDLVAAVTVALENRWLLQLPPDKMPAHPAARAFPGVPAVDVKASVQVEAVIDPAIPRWTGIGLYAMPGQLVQVELAEPVLAGKLGIRIGCHTDELWGTSEWLRFPQITTVFPLDRTTTVAANPFGGPIFIEVPEKCVLAGPVRLRISGAIPMPRFELGKTTPEEWRRQREFPGPWAELAGRKLALCVPSQYIRKLDDPGKLMEFWDRVVAADEQLAGWAPGDRTSPERLVPDVQISVGYMHSGYPIMTGDDVYATMVDLGELMKGQWGFFHEIGHNFQCDEWTFDGTVEVTENLFSMYIIEKICGLAKEKGHEAIEKAAQHKMIRDYLADGAQFKKWQDDPFLALGMYIQLIDAFGWDPFTKVFADYRHLAPAAKPTTEEAKRDLWMVRISRATGRNLGPFFDAWGVPVSANAKQQVAGLPAWMPDEPPGKSQKPKQ